MSEKVNILITKVQCFHTYPRRGRSMGKKDAFTTWTRGDF